MTPPAGSTAIVLFTRDLRVHDQPALDAAVRTHERVVPLFVLDDAILRTAGANRRAFLGDCLADLRESLRRLGGDLVVRRGDPVEATICAAVATGAASVFIGADASAYAQARQRRLLAACRESRIRLAVEDTITAAPRGLLAPADRDHYRVFTPYWRRWSGVPLRSPTPPAPRLRLPDGLAPGDLPEAPAPPSSLPRGGEREARRRLDRWLADGLETYAETRNLLTAGATSRLSPDLHFGCVSAAEVVARARTHGAVADEFTRQLCWRDFYLQLLAANPATPRDDLHPREREWRDDPETLERWATGQTGYPIVDAAMRQLRVEGWLHNRARLVVASFLTKTLGIDWRAGVAVFADLLVDGDVASNVGNWQWVAGTGVDTRPGRRFNPVRQAKRFDPDGAYVRRYVPELIDVDGAAAHEPWRAPLTRVAPDYPPRIVEYEAVS